MLRTLFICLITLLNTFGVHSQSTQPISIPADTAHWDLQGKAKLTEYQNRKCIFLDGGAAVLKSFDMRDGIIDVDVSTAAKRGFFGIQFRIDREGLNGEWIYLRPHKSGLPDAIQYTPVINTGLNWQLYNGCPFYSKYSS